MLKILQFFEQLFRPKKLNTLNDCMIRLSNYTIQSYNSMSESIELIVFNSDESVNITDVDDTAENHALISNQPVFHSPTCAQHTTGFLKFLVNEPASKHIVSNTAPNPDKIAENNAREYLKGIGCGIIVVGCIALVLVLLYWIGHITYAYHSIFLSDVIYKQAFERRDSSMFYFDMIVFGGWLIMISVFTVVVSVATVALVSVCMYQMFWSLYIIYTAYKKSYIVDALNDDPVGVEV
jgi:hypothetical protein